MDAKRVSKKPNGSWEKGKQKVFHFILGQFNNESNAMTGTDFVGKSTRNSPTSSGSEFNVEDLNQGNRLPLEWQKCLDLKTGAVYYVNSEAETRQSSKSTKSRSNEGVKEKIAEDDIVEEGAATMRLVG
ncbi:hypothetical protein KI387_023205, partial [Taxus chinensis]